MKLTPLTGVVLAIVICTSLFCAHQPVAGGSDYIRVETERDIYSLGGPVKVTPVLVNQSDAPVTYTMAYVVNIFDPKEAVIWEREMVVYGKITIPAQSEGKLSEFTWDQKDKAGKQVSEGRYRIFIRLFEYRFRDIHGHKWITVR